MAGRSILRAYAPVLAISGVLLAGCTDWFKDDKVPLPGDRVAVLQSSRAITPDETLADMAVELPPPEEYADWPQAGGIPDHALHHLALGDAPRQAWSASVGSGSSGRGYLLGAPVIADGRVYAMDSRHVVTARDLASGRELWRVDLTPEDEDDATISGGVSFFGGRVYATTGFAEVVAMDAADGKIAWRSRQTAPMRAAPTVTAERVFVLTIDNQLVALATDDGRRLWSHSGISETAGLLGGASPAVDAGLVLAPYSSGELYALRVETGRIAWSDNLAAIRRADAVSALADIRGRPVIDRGVVFAASHSGRVAAIDLRTGNRLWDREIASQEAPWVAGDYVFILSTTGEVYALRREDGRVRWSAELPRFRDPARQRDPILWAGPVLAGDRLILVNSQEEAWTLSPYTGEALGRVSLPGRASIAPIVAAQTLLFLTDSGDLVAYR